MQRFEAVITSKYDEALAACRSLLKQGGDDFTVELLEGLKIQDNDRYGSKAIVSAFAFLGVLTTLVAMEQNP